jgi:hypothetical protein
MKFIDASKIIMLETFDNGGYESVRVYMQGREKPFIFHGRDKDEILAYFDHREVAQTLLWLPGDRTRRYL